MAYKARVRERPERADTTARPPRARPEIGDTNRALTPGVVLALQRTAGNAAVARTLSREPADTRAADRVARVLEQLDESRECVTLMIEQLEKGKARLVATADMADAQLVADLNLLITASDREAEGAREALEQLRAKLEASLDNRAQAPSEADRTQAIRRLEKALESLAELDLKLEARGYQTGPAAHAEMRTADSLVKQASVAPARETIVGIGRLGHRALDVLEGIQDSGFATTGVHERKPASGWRPPGS